MYSHGIFTLSYFVEVMITCFPFFTHRSLHVSLPLFYRIYTFYASIIRVYLGQFTATLHPIIIIDLRYTPHKNDMALFDQTWTLRHEKPLINIISINVHKTKMSSRNTGVQQVHREDTQHLHVICVFFCSLQLISSSFSTTLQIQLSSSHER